MTHLLAIVLHTVRTSLKTVCKIQDSLIDNIDCALKIAPDAATFWNLIPAIFMLSLVEFRLTQTVGGYLVHIS